MYKLSKKENAAGSPAIRREDEPEALSPERTREPGVIEVEFHQDVRPAVASDSGDQPAALRSSSRGELATFNRILQNHGLRRAESSFGLSTGEADTVQAMAAARGKSLPHYGNFLTLHFPEKADVDKIAAELNALPEVARAVPVPRALPPATPLNEPLVGNSPQVAVNPATGLENQWYVFRCRADRAWALASGAGVVVADIDWGYRVTHQELASRLDLSRAYNAYDGSTNVSYGGSIGHGTAVMGIAGGSDNDLGLAGFAFGASLWPVQANGGPGTALGGNAWARAIEWVRQADSGGRRKVIILEVQTGSYGNYEMVPSVNAAIRAAIADGVAVCVAAGNGNRDAGLDDAGNPIPATGSILVGATAYHPTQNTRAGFSNYGSRVVVCAPGDPSHDLTCSSTGDNRYRNGFGGTSGATPKVAGAAALMLEVNPSLSHDDIREILRSTGSAVVLDDPAKTIGTFLDVEAAVKAASGQASKWHYNVDVLQTYASVHAQNAWVYLAGMGWRKIKTGATDGVTNTLLACAKSRTNNRKIHVFADATNLFRVQLL